MLLQDLEKKKLIRPPEWLSDNCSYLTIMGSTAYGVSSDTSDMDIYGFCIPNKSLIFPHLVGEIEGFGRQKQRFEQWQEHHIKDKDALAGKGRSYDFAVFNIVKYFSLCMDCNPNMIDSIFTPINCVLHATKIANMVREKRKLFLHKGAYHKFLGYAHSQLHKAKKTIENEDMDEIYKFEKDHDFPTNTTFSDVEQEMKIRGFLEEGVDEGSWKMATRGNGHDLTGQNDEQLKEYYNVYKRGMDKSKRFESRKINGQDNKFLYHLVRLSDECEQILSTGDIDLQRAKEHMKAVRRGDVSEQDLRDWFSVREKTLEKLYSESKLPHSPDENKIKALLVNCLEEHYGSLANCITMPDAPKLALQEIQAILDRYRPQIQL